MDVVIASVPASLMWRVLVSMVCSEEFKSQVLSKSFKDKSCLVFL